MDNIKKLELVIFDMDGLLIDSEKISIQAWKNVIKKYKININEEEFIKNIVGSNIIYFKDSLGKLFKDDKTYSYFIDDHNKETFKIAENEGIEVKTGANELIEYLLLNKIKIALASSSFRNKVNKYLNKIKLYDKFDYIVCGEDVDNVKPYPDIYNKICNYFEIDKNNIIILEDSKNGLLSAKNSGIEKRFYIPDIFYLSNKDKNELAYKTFSNLLEVKDYLIDNKIIES